MTTPDTDSAAGRSGRRWMAAGALLAGVGVALGAFGAHGLHDRLAEAGQLDNWATAVRYQVWHALALAILGVRGERGARTPAPTAPCFVLGTLAFSGSLYALALGVPSSAIWFVTPLGGLLLLLGWAFFLVSVVRPPAAASDEGGHGSTPSAPRES